MSSLKKRASDRVDYVFDYADWLSDGDTLVSATTPVVDDITTTATVDGTSVIVWIEGGEPGHAYKITVKATTAQGRVKNECLKVRVKDA